MVDLTGQHFGRWLVLKLDHIKKYEKYWECICDCGTIRTVRQQSLTRGVSNSCGCLQKEIVTIHGHSYDLIYKQWTNMIQRCTNPNHKDYYNYGDNGIYVCDSWLIFENFLNDMGELPFKGATIERIDNSGPYCPNNCKWATIKEQRYNTSRSVINTKEEADRIRELYKNGMTIKELQDQYLCSYNCIFYIVKNKRWL